jgi:hypothetical protein
LSARFGILEALGGAAKGRHDRPWRAVAVLARRMEWNRIKAAAKRFDVDVEADDWRELFAAGKARKR